ncbi:MAG: hypothetical protein ACJ71W_21665 [Terriglobales bacterium]
MKKLIGVVLLLIGSVWACPITATCPYDGEQMTNTGNCTGVGASHACEFSHRKMEIDAHGKTRFVTHTAWANCGE